MRIVSITLRIFFLILPLLWTGCNQFPTKIEPSAKIANNSDKLSDYTLYAATKIYIMPLTELICINNTEELSRLKVYVSLLDSFGCQKKSSGIFRFELYERIPRSAELKGKRIAIWPDIDLIKAVKNNDYWRDFLRAYEFSLDFESNNNRNYILQVTYLFPNSKQLSADFPLKCTE